MQTTKSSTGSPLALKTSQTIQNDFLVNHIKSCSEFYRERRKDKVNWLIYGDCGTGKTTMLKTALLPLYVFSFDPGGCSVLESLPENMRVLDTQYEEEDWKNPSAFRRWEENYNKLKKSGAFNHFGTVAIDSLTYFSDACMNEILRRSGRAGTTPQLQDYFVLISAICDALNDLTNLPCDTVLTAHMGTERDEVTGKLMATLLVPTDKAKVRIPQVFSMVLVTTTIPTKDKKPEYRVQTATSGIYKARARIGGDVFDFLEKPDICYLRQKAGKPVNHLPPLPI